MTSSGTELSCDFLSYLENRLGSSHEATLALLGDWLSSYEPQHLRGSGLARTFLTEDDERLSA